MNSLTDLREVVDVVIGVDTHVHTHSAAIDNLAFQMSIPQQRTSPGLRRNLHQLMHGHYPPLIAGEPFVLA